MSYRQLTREQRYQIHILIKEGYNQTQIALLLGFDKSTISRELRRNCGAHGYFPNQAHGMARRRRRHSHGPRIPLETWRRGERLVRPPREAQHISGRLARETE